MRAHEFITEAKRGKIKKRQQNPTVGLDVFRDRQFADRIYELNRVMMAAAMSDGKNSVNLDGESWAGRENVAVPYTALEQQMLQQAFKAVGSNHRDLNHGDLRSQELDSTYVKSPVIGFKGFKK